MASRMDALQRRRSGGVYPGALSGSGQDMADRAGLERRRGGWSQLGGTKMKVNIVCPNMPEDSILYRLASILSRETGWTISDQPKANHDLNYAITYIDFAQRFTDWRATPWAAYFSHYETGTSYK